MKKIIIYFITLLNKFIALLKTISIRYLFSFLWMVFLYYNRILYNLLVHGSLIGAKETYIGNIFVEKVSYKTISQQVFLFFFFSLLHFLYINLDISFYYLFSSCYVWFLVIYILNALLDEIGIRDSRYPGIINIRSILLLLFSIIGTVALVYYHGGILIDLSYFYKLSKYIMKYIFTLYIIFYIFHIIRALLILYADDYDDIRYMYLKTQNYHLLYSFIIIFFIPLIDNLYSNVKKFGFHFSNWTFDYSGFIFMLNSFSVSLIILLITVIVFNFVRLLSDPEYEVIRVHTYNFLFLLGYIYICHGNFLSLVHIFVIVLSYLFFCYVVKKIILDYLKTYKYLNGVLYLIILLIFISTLYIIS